MRPSICFCWGCGNEVSVKLRADETTPCCDYEVWHGERDEAILSPLTVEADA